MGLSRNANLEEGRLLPLARLGNTFDPTDLHAPDTHGRLAPLRFTERNDIHSPEIAWFFRYDRFHAPPFLS
jgi:hypothetical protein